MSQIELKEQAQFTHRVSTEVCDLTNGLKRKPESLQAGWRHTDLHRQPRSTAEGWKTNIYCHRHMHVTCVLRHVMATDW